MINQTKIRANLEVISDSARQRRIEGPGLREARVNYDDCIETCSCAFSRQHMSTFDALSTSRCGEGLSQRYRSPNPRIAFSIISLKDPLPGACIPVLCRRKIRSHRGVDETFLIKRQTHPSSMVPVSWQPILDDGMISPIGVSTDERHAFKCGQYRVVVTVVHDTFR
jgi:hypothetical protein